MGKVVVIDDRVTNRNILTRLVMSVEEGLQVSAFGSPVKALQRLRTDHEQDLIITDYNMPEMDGAAFIRALRAIPALSDVPIVVVTIYEEREFCYRALEAGATDFLLSPLDHLEFRARVRNLLTLRRQQRLLRDRAETLEKALSHQAGGQTADLDSLRRSWELIPVPVSVADLSGNTVYANQPHAELLETAQAGGDSEVGRVDAEDYGLRQLVLDQKVCETGRALTHLVSLATGEKGAARNFLVSKGPIADLTGEVRYVLTVMVEVSDVLRRSVEEATNARHDPLTGLPSAAFFRDRLESEIEVARGQSEMLALLHLDLDRFNAINEAFGEAFGDRVLRMVGERLAARVRPNESIARLRSDEFVVLQAGAKRSDDATELVHRLNEAFAEPFLVEEEELHLGASVGITLFPADGKQVDTLFKNAELALYRAKASGRDAYRFFAREMNRTARRALAMERELRQAIADEQFTVHYQPQVEIATSRVIGMEALVRWNHPHRGLVPPGEFIQLAEDIGLIAPLTSWVLRSACQQHRRWRDSGLDELRLSVNLSPVQFRERGVEFMIERILRDAGLPPQSLDVELTENAVIENSQTASASLRYLHQLGVTLSIDDFGTGYSSLSYIKRLPVQRLKIDRSFVRGLESSVNDEVIVRAIINLGHSLGLRVIAEGVETEGQLRFLARLNCDEVQGNLVSPPVDAETFQAGLRSGRLAAAAACLT